MNELHDDPRYKLSIPKPDDDYHVYDWGVKKENSVSQYLTTLPSYFNNIGATIPELDAKEFELSFSWRNTIPWSLECETSGFSRDKALKSFSIRLN